MSSHPPTPTAARFWHPRFPFDPARWPFFYGWVILVVSSLGVLASMPGQTVGVGAFTDILIEELGLSRMQLSVAYALGTGAGALLLGWGGSLYDRFGERKFFTLSCALFGLALLFMGFLGSVNALARDSFHDSWITALCVATLGFGSIRFLGQGLVTLGARNVLMKWFNRRRGLVTSLSGVFMGVGFNASPYFLRVSIEGIGWRETYWVLGALLLLVFTLLGWLFFRDTPEDVGLEMDGGAGKQSPGQGNADLILRREFTRGEALRSYSFWIFTLMLATQGLFFTAYAFHIIELAKVFGVAEAEMLSFFIQSAFVSIPTTLIVGIVADRTRLRFILMFMGTGGVLWAAGVLLLPETIGKVFLVLGMGTSGGCFGVLLNVTFARYYGRKHLGAINGAATSVLVWFSAVGPFLFVGVHDGLGSYRPAFAAGGLLYLALVLLGIFAHNPQRSLPEPADPPPQPAS